MYTSDCPWVRLYIFFLIVKLSIYMYIIQIKLKLTIYIWKTKILNFINRDAKKIKLNDQTIFCFNE